MVGRLRKTEAAQTRVSAATELKTAKIEVGCGVAEIAGVSEAAVRGKLSAAPYVGRFDKNTGRAVLERFYTVLEDGTLHVSPGLVPRVEKFLRRDGWTVDVVDHRGPSGALPWQGQLKCQNASECQFVEQFTHDNPKKSVLVVVPSEHYRHFFAKVLGRAYASGPLGRVVGAGGSKGRKQEGCTTIVTPDGLVNSDPTAWDVVIVAGASTIMQQDCREELGRFRRAQANDTAPPCHVFCVHDASLDLLSQLVFEEAFGPLMMGAAGTDQVAPGRAILLESPSVSQIPSSRSTSVGTSVPLWLDRLRNTRIADVATAIAGDDQQQLAALELLDAAGLKTAAIIVDRPEHAYVLHHLLPDWHVDLDEWGRESHRGAARDDRGIFLLSGDYEGCLPVADIILRASGGTNQLPDSAYCDDAPPLVIDFYERSPDGIDDNSHQRMFDYEQAGWNVVISSAAPSHRR